MKKLLVYSACLLAAIAMAIAPVVVAQTKPHTGQLRGPSLPDARVLVLSAGRIGFASLGAGLEVVQTPSGWELRAAQQAQASDAILSRSADGGWALPSGCTLQALYRNGIRQARTTDYTVSAGVVRFTDGGGDPSLPDDVVLAECR